MYKIPNIYNYLTPILFSLIVFFLKTLNQACIINQNCKACLSKERNLILDSLLNLSMKYVEYVVFFKGA